MSASIATGQIVLGLPGYVHRFVEFSDDLATWVVFWGPPGGEPA